MRTLNQDDFSVGMLVVGMGHPPRDVPIYAGAFDMTIVGTMQRADSSYMGEVFRVDAVDLPLVVMTKVADKNGKPPHKNGYDFGPRTWDLRDGFRWGSPNAEFLKALNISAAITATRGGG